MPSYFCVSGLSFCLRESTFGDVLGVLDTGDLFYDGSRLGDLLPKSARLKVAVA